MSRSAFSLTVLVVIFFAMASLVTSVPAQAQSTSVIGVTGRAGMVSEMGFNWWRKWSEYRGIARQDAIQCTTYPAGKVSVCWAELTQLLRTMATYPEWRQKSRYTCETTKTRVVLYWKDLVRLTTYAERTGSLPRNASALMRQAASAKSAAIGSLRSMADTGRCPALD